MITAKQRKELRKDLDPKRIVNELKSHLNLCSVCDIIDKVKELEEEIEDLKKVKELEEKVEDLKEGLNDKKLLMIKEQIEEIEDLKLRAPMPLEYYENAIGNLEEEIKHKNEKFSEWCEENKELKEENDKLEEKYDKLYNDNSDLRKQYQEEFQKQEYNTMVKEEQEELNSIGKDDENGNYQDIIEDLEQANKELQEENKELNANFKEEREEKKKFKKENKELKEDIEQLKFNLGGMTCDRDAKEEEIDKLIDENKTSNDVNIKLKDDNVKLIDEIECMKSHSDMSEEEYEGELKDKEAIVNYLTEELDKYKKLFNKSKKENEKVKDIKGIVVNEDKTIITINGIQLMIGDKFISDITEYTLREIYVGKSGKYSLRTDKITIRLGANFITGKFKIVKKE